MKPFDPTKQTWATAAQAADYLQVCKVTILRWCKIGKLPATKTTAGYRIAAETLTNFYTKGQ